ncbi:catechol 2,3-dioxygenase-like lactoylglutathione lyase family enzyme [Paucibacter oligotrophus]|uniref:Catechol 2,3-dioxygenase-like lactoylglutathione lyase family enzyme n=2 Tax=Roseateles oligotrophus TaxID=1769250 RepID=A0A840L667_9BURK|nr:catechol 2,3-dioxygenase-like lactoylglutathione lyase family enzyme [Roseateles oligotrophus]
MGMLHHLSFGVKNLRRAADFYDAVLEPLGYVRVWTDFEGDADTQAVGYGEPGSDDKLALKQRPDNAVAPGPGFHLAFSAPSREAVDRFHAAALGQGGQDNGAPGLRPHYGPHYYAAFVVDPEGIRIEAVINTEV